MSASTHTAGPWIVTLDQTFPAELAIDAMVDGRTVHIALVHGVGTDEATQANASLIAAAPQLKEALQALVYWHDQGTHIDESWWDEARTELAAAEGQS